MIRPTRYLVCRLLLFSNTLTVWATYPLDSYSASRNCLENDSFLRGYLLMGLIHCVHSSDSKPNLRTQGCPCIAVSVVCATKSSPCEGKPPHWEICHCCQLALAWSVKMTTGHRATRAHWWRRIRQWSSARYSKSRKCLTARGGCKCTQNQSEPCRLHL